MNNLPALLGSAAANALTTQGANLATRALTPAATNIITQAMAPEIGKATSQLLAKGAGSTLSGVLAPASVSGVQLPQAQVATPSFSDYFGASDLATALQQGDVDVPSITEILSPSQNKALRTGVSELVSATDPYANGVYGVSAKSNLPSIKTSDYTAATGLSGEDIPPYMRNFLSEKNGVSLKDGARWGEIFPDLAGGGEAGSFAGTPDDILSRYQTALEDTANKNAIYTPENVSNYLLANPQENARYTDTLTNLLNTDGTVNIPVAATPSSSESIAVSGLKTPETVKVAQETVAAAPQATFQQTTRNLEDVLGTDTGGAGQGGAGGGVTITPPSPDDTGFNVPLETNKSGEKVIRVNPQAARTTAAQKKASFQNRKWLDSMNATSKQYEMALSKSNSYGGHYKTPAERAIANGLNPANISDRLQALVDAREIPLEQAEQYATEQGVRVNLPKLELTQAQAQALAQNGVDIETIVREGTATPIEAEKIYKTLRNDGYRLMKATDGTTLERGQALVNASKSISDALDKTMDSIGLNYKDSLLKNAAAAGEDQQYLQKIAEGKEFKFSDLRRDMSDLIRLQDLSANKLKAGKTINIAGINTGIPNPTGNIADKVKEAYYNAAERVERAKAGAGAGAGAGGASGGSGASTGYTFEGAGGGGTAQSGLSGLLGKARKIAPYAAAAGIGYIAGGGRSGSSNLGDMTTLGGDSLTQEEAPVADPYQTQTIGGYNMEELEEGYARALAAGDTNAAKQIASLMEVLENRVKRVSASTESVSGSNTMSAGMNILNQLYQMYKQMGGSQGVIGGNITNLLNDLSGGAYNADVSTYNQTRALTSSLLARALGEKGTLSDTDRKYINDNLPKVTDAPEVAEKKFRAIYQMLETASAK
jgi:hypothetical protein